MFFSTAAEHQRNSSWGAVYLGASDNIITVIIVTTIDITCMTMITMVLFYNIPMVIAQLMAVEGVYADTLCL